MNVEPARAVLLAEARVERDRILGVADGHAAEIVAGAHRRAEELVETATREGASAAGVAGAHALAAAQRGARATVLHARAALHDELVAAAHAAAAGRRREPEHDALVTRLGALARSQLGDAATVEQPVEGGIRARAGARSVDYSLPTLVERALARAGPRIEELWA